MSKRNIPGIHNYCDRWCERCMFTSRCSVFESEQESNPETLDMKNQAFWQRLSENFVKAKEMLQQAAEKHGIDLEQIQQDVEEVEKKSEDVLMKSQKHPLVKLTREYALFAHQWLKTQPGMIEKLEKLKADISIGVESHEDVKTQTETIKDCLAIIQWYHTFVEPKFMRAMMGKLEDWGDEEDDMPRDYDGSAKIGIISIERSMQAWARLFELLPQQEDDFLKALSLLEKIKGLALKEFPESMKFIRPGFDE